MFVVDNNSASDGIQTTARRHTHTHKLIRQFMHTAQSKWEKINNLQIYTRTHILNYICTYKHVI